VINNSINVSQYEGAPPPSDDASRRIDGGPIYTRAKMLTLAEGACLQLWSNGSIKDAAKWNLTTVDLADLLTLALQSGRFRSSEWCRQKPNGPWAACDAYTVTRLEWNTAAHKEFEITYYFKVAVSKTGKLLLSASNHPEGT